MAGSEVSLMGQRGFLQSVEREVFPARGSGSQAQTVTLHMKRAKHPGSIIASVNCSELYSFLKASLIHTDKRQLATQATPQTHILSQIKADESSDNLAVAKQKDK